MVDGTVDDCHTLDGGAVTLHLRTDRSLNGWLSSGICQNCLQSCYGHIKSSSWIWGTWNQDFTRHSKACSTESPSGRTLHLVSCYCRPYLLHTTECLRSAYHPEHGSVQFHMYSMSGCNVNFVCVMTDDILDKFHTVFGHHDTLYNVHHAVSYTHLTLPTNREV